MIYRLCTFKACKFNKESACQAPYEYYLYCEYRRLKQDSELNNLQQMLENGNGGNSCPYCGKRM